MRRLDGKPANKSFRDLTGMKFGRLTALYTLPREVGEIRKWMCRCDCGVIKPVVACNLTGGRTKSCGCTRDGVSRENIKYAHAKAAKAGSAFRALLAQYKYHAKVRGFLWELSDAQFEALTTSPCYYTGGLPSSVMEAQSGEIYTYNGVDRLDNTKGYTLENCVPCCVEINMMKKAMTEERFIELCSKVSERFKNVKSSN